MILIDTLKETFIINPKKDKKYASNNSLYKYKLKNMITNKIIWEYAQK